MTRPNPIELDALIFGGGIAGLWTLSELSRRGHACVLLESSALGQGQTVWSQGIIHGGLKYTLSGLMTGSAEAIREMPGVWRECLEGRREPDLSSAPARSPYCHLWQTTSLRSRAGMIGARAGLRVAPVVLRDAERPAVLRECPGTVARLDEQVVDPVAVLGALSAPHAAIARTPPESVRFEADTVSVHGLPVRPRHIVLTAGGGNGPLRRAAGLPQSAMQIRPLRMVMLRGPAGALAELNGHCVDGSKTRATITSALDRSGRRIWQIGGEVAEHGAGMDPPALLAHARAEVHAVIPGLETRGCEWSWYQADRAEQATRDLRRPEDVGLIREGRFVTAWPTKLALAPRLAERVAETIGPPSGLRAPVLPKDWERPRVAAPPWDEARVWVSDERVASAR